MPLLSRAWTLSPILQRKARFEQIILILQHKTFEVNYFCKLGKCYARCKNMKHNFRLEINVCWCWTNDFQRSALPSGKAGHKPVLEMQRREIANRKFGWSRCQQDQMCIILKSDIIYRYCLNKDFSLNCSFNSRQYTETKIDCVAVSNNQLTFKLSFSDQRET